MSTTDVIVLGAGAAGLMCAIEAGKRGRAVTVLDHADKPGKKILISGGGRCNFTNLEVAPDRYISDNPHFCKSALSRYTQWDFIDLVKKHRISFHEKTLGQLFCDGSAREILEMLLKECKAVGVKVVLNTSITSVNRHPREGGDDGKREAKNSFQISTNHGTFTGQALVVATGGLSIPKMGATPLGYQIAEQFGIKVRPTRAGLVPFTAQPPEKDRLATLSGISVPCVATTGEVEFKENLLFTHRGLSGPAMLQISSYWQPGQPIEVRMLPDMDLLDYLHQRQTSHPKQSLKTCLSDLLAKRMIELWFLESQLARSMSSLTKKELTAIVAKLQPWIIRPSGTEGYRTAEVTIGGVDCDELSSKTMESRTVPGLYFIGEVVDVTGWLGGYNFQWAWSSGWCTGQVA